MKTIDEKIKAIETLNRTPTRSKADIKAIVMQEMDTFVGTKAQLMAKEAELEEKVVTMHRKEREEVNKKVYALWGEIKEDVSEDEGLSDHPKNKQAWTIAWDEAHSGGYGDVVNFYRTICELLKA